VRKLHFGMFDNAQANGFGMAPWRHPDDQRHRFTELGYWIELAKMCEDAKLDFMFLADAWGFAQVNGQRPDVCFTEGLDLPRLDPAIVLAAVTPETSELGLVMTAATLVELPYALARRLSTLDHLSGGRLGWNVVTTGLADTTSANFGSYMPPHDKRYDMADDFMEVVYKLWEGCWEPGAVLADKSGIYADPRKVHRIDHEGPHFSSHGYGNAPASPQGTPLLFQAGTSSRGRQFAARHAECVFLGSNPRALKGHINAIRKEAAEIGRDPMSVKALAGVSTVIGSTREQAQKEYRRIIDAQNPDIAVASYAMFTGIDLSAYEPTTPMADLHTELGQTQVDRFKDQTVGDVLADFRERGVNPWIIVGTPQDAADELCAVAEEASLDGFLMTPLIQPRATQDFIEQVLPLLKQRGAAREEYEEHTLRERILGPGRVKLLDDHPGASYRFGRARAQATA
jgi:FMN-dependent oxidoreductase (nitrilotriacetate monooxygenase family)